MLECVAYWGISCDAVLRLDRIPHLTQIWLEPYSHKAKWRCVCSVFISKILPSLAQCTGWPCHNTAAIILWVGSQPDTPMTETGNSGCGTFFGKREKEGSVWMDWNYQPNVLTCPSLWLISFLTIHFPSIDSTINYSLDK